VLKELEEQKQKCNLVVEELQQEKGRSGQLIGKIDFMTFVTQICD
jgi:hypothetical protein